MKLSSSAFGLRDRRNPVVDCFSTNRDLVTEIG
jgi:hypothetical protein